MKNKTMKVMFVHAVWSKGVYENNIWRAYEHHKDIIGHKVPDVLGFVRWKLFTDHVEC